MSSSTTATPAFYTIGHSTRSTEEFLGLLHEAAIGALVDVRTVPRSRTNPQFNSDSLPDTLAAAGIDYHHIRELGGLRGRQKLSGVPPNDFWENSSFRNYADYATGPEFHDGLEQLLAIGAQRTTAIMCAEAVWWRCHRRIIADYLLAADRQVMHIMGPGKLVPASLTPAARPTADGSLAYPR